MMNINDSSLWSKLNMEDDLDNDTLFIELHCLISEVLGNRFTKDSTLREPYLVDDTTKEGKEFLDKQNNPGPNFNVSKNSKTEVLLSEFDRFAIKYGQGRFDNFIRNFYISYPIPEPNNTVSEYLDQFPVFQFHMKLKHIYSFLHAIDCYFKRRGETIE